MGTNKSLPARIVALEPVLTRGAIVAVLGAVGMVLNHNFSTGTVEYVVNIVLAGFAFLSAVVTRSAVVPTKKVITYQPDPFRRPDDVVTQLKDQY